MGHNRNRDIKKSGIYRTGIKKIPVLLDGRGCFWHSTQLAEFVDSVGCQEGCVVHLSLSDTDPAQLVTDYPDIFFSGLHTNRG